MDCFCGRNLDTMLLARYVHARKTSSCCINYESSQGDRNVLSSDELLARKQVLLVYSNFVTRTSRDPNPLCSSTSTFVVHLRWLLGAFVVGWVPSFSSMGVNGWIVKKHRPSNAKSANPWVHRSSGRWNISHASRADFERWATTSKWKDSLSIVALTKPAGHFVTPTLKRIGPAIWNWIGPVINNNLDPSTFHR